MSAYQFRSSDLDFALFLADQRIGDLIPELWVERHREVIRTERFAQQLLRVEALVSPDLVADSFAARKARYRHQELRRAS